MSGTRFSDRAAAGRELARRLAERHHPDPVVYALPRGGLPVAVQVARALSAPLDLVLVRKLGAPGQPELAIGAVVDGETPETVLNEDILRLTGADARYVAAARARALEEIARRRAAWLGGRAPIPATGRTAIVVDDGLATGATARAALHALRRQRPARLVLAAPVCAEDAAASLRAEADEVLCLREGGIPFGVGGCYDDFRQLDDADVMALLASLPAPGSGPAPAA
ncbi:phosphoribosyltransferase [Falsiroseomonas bella]|uniref:Phosphoribosyltransferase n=1 Tax=Falsiroseomonas bella TaxID=2184016 RepID=A0A317FLE5_9PROT|nr:phosphoribosyltransferase family protein [Falsiroseomonas bella]PWS39192.1 phosphoribosyltransferase [Falsiroseomonas bella]